MSPNPLDPLSSRPSGAAPASAPASAGRAAQVDPLKLLRRHARTLSVSSVLGVVLGVLVWAILYFTWPEYSTHTDLLVTDPAGDPMTVSGSLVNESQDMVSLYIQNQIIRLRSDDIISDALKNPELRATNWFKSFGPDPSDTSNEEQVTLANAYRTTQARKWLLEYVLSASQFRGSSTIQVWLRGRQAEELPKILDIIVGVYLNRVRNEVDTQNSNIARVFNQAIHAADDDISLADEQIKQFTVQQDLPSLQTQTHEATIGYQLLSDQTAKLEISAQGARDTYSELVKAQQEGNFQPSAEDYAMVERDPVIQTRDERIRQLQETRETALHRFGENHYFVKNLDREIQSVQLQRKADFDRLLAQRTQVLLAAAKQQADGLNAQLIGLQPRLEEARLKMRDLSLKLQGYQSLQDRRDAALKRRELASQTLSALNIKIARPDTVRVRQQLAAVESKLSFPLWYIVIPGVALLSLAGVGGFLYLYETIDQRVKSPTDVKGLAGLDLLGVVPDAADDPSSPARVESVVQDDPAGLMAEAYRQLRTALLAQMDQRGMKTLLVSSAQPQSGSTVVSSNLAMSLAFASRKVLLIDVNLRRPSQHMVFGIPQGPGLIDVLRGTVSVDSVLFHKVEPSIDILPVGILRDAHPEMLESQAFRNLLNQLERNYDMIILDGPPALIASDCQMLIKQVDGLLVVVRAMADKRGQIGRMVRQLQGGRAQLVGAVLNRARTSAGGYFQKSYEEFYRYRGKPRAAEAPTTTPTKA